MNNLNGQWTISDSERKKEKFVALLTDCIVHKRFKYRRLTRIGYVARMEEMIIANKFLIGKRTGKMHLCYKYKCEIKFMWLGKETGRSGF
jgi:hypothetical protein